MGLGGYERETVKALEIILSSSSQLLRASTRSDSWILRLPWAPPSGRLLSLTLHKHALSSLHSGKGLDSGEVADTMNFSIYAAFDFGLHCTTEDVTTSP